MTIKVTTGLAALVLAIAATVPAHAQTTHDYRVLATSKTSTLEAEMTALGGKELVAITRKTR